MNVVGYLNHADLLLENEHGVAVVEMGNYVLSLGDRVDLKGMNPDTQKQRVQIVFANTSSNECHEDELNLKFEGSKESLKQYLARTTVH